MVVASSDRPVRAVDQSFDRAAEAAQKPPIPPDASPATDLYQAPRRQLHRKLSRVSTQHLQSRVATAPATSVGKQRASPTRREFRAAGSSGESDLFLRTRDTRRGEQSKLASETRPHAVESPAHPDSHTTPRVAHVPVVRFAVISIIYRARSAVRVLFYFDVRASANYDYDRERPNQSFILA